MVLGARLPRGGGLGATVTAAVAILVSRFPGSVTPGELPILPEFISIHDDRLSGGFIVYRWFETEPGGLEQSAPERHERLEDAWLRIPPGYDPEPCPEDFGRMIYRRRK